MSDNLILPDLTSSDRVQMLTFTSIRPERVRGIVYALAYASGLIGLIALAGWTFNVAALKSILPGFNAMQPWTAVNFILAAFALSLATSTAPLARRASALPALVLALTAGSPLLQNLTGATFAMDLWLFPSSLASSQTTIYPNPGRMSLVAAISLTSLACALVLAPRAKRMMLKVAFSSFATVPLIAGLAALTGFSMRLEALDAFFVGGPLALHSAFNLLLLSLGTLALRPDAGWVQIARRGRAGRNATLLAGLGALLLVLATDAAIKAGKRGANAAVSSHQLESLLSTLKDAETGQRGFLLTGKDAYLEPYESARARLPDDMASVQADLATVHGLPPFILSRLRSLIRQKFAEMAETIALQRAGRQADALALVETDYGKATMDAIRAEIAALIGPMIQESESQSVHAWFIAKAASTGLAMLAVLTVVSLGMATRKQRESAASLAISRARQQAIGDAVDYGIWACDVDGRPIYASPSLLKLIGITEQMFLKDGWRDALSSDDAERIAAVWRECKKTLGKWEIEHSFRGRDGHWHPVLASGVPVFDAAGALTGWTGINLDISRLKQAEGQLKDSEALFRLMVNVLPQVTWIADAAGNITYFNQRWEEYTGLTLEESYGDGWIKSSHPDDLQRVWGDWQESIASQNVYSVECRLRRADGTYRWWLIRGEPHTSDNITVEKWFGTCTDIQDIMQAREVLAGGQAELEALVERRTHDLAEMQERLAHLQRMEALGQLAGGIAHDFNNVLQAVQGGTALIERRCTDAAGVRRLARLVFDAANRGASITGRLLAFSRRGDLRTKAVDPMALLTELQEVLRHTLGTGIEVRADVPSGLPALLADKGQLETVLVNLATNARDAMKSTGVLKLAAAIEVLGHDVGSGYPGNLKRGSYIRLSVTDTGIGMMPGVLERAAEPFFTTKEQGKGTGLGLSLARGFAEQSGGGLHIESAPGRGTTVKLWLPLADGISTLASDPPKTAPLAAERGRVRLLVVDDDPIVRELTTDGLQAEGYDVMAAADGPAALAMLDAGAVVHVMICDLSMPGMDGLAVIREAQRRHQGLRAILLTGFVTDVAEIAVSGALSGAFSLLRKPATMVQIAERVTMLLEDHTAGGGDAPVAM